MTACPADALPLREAADQLDALWELDAARGQRDSLGGCEYVRCSAAPRLRQMADKIDPPLGELLHVFQIDTFWLAESVIGCSVTLLARWLKGEAELDDGAEAKLNIITETLRHARPVAS